MGRPSEWVKGFSGSAALKSPGAPSHRREIQKLFWLEIAKGLTSQAAVVAVGAGPVLGSRWFRQSGGMPAIDLTPISGRYLSFHEREEIALLRVQGKGVRDIARHLDRSPWTISRELLRNAATRGGGIDYRASVAQWKAELFAQRPKVAKMVTNEALQYYVQERLAGHIRHPNGHDSHRAAGTTLEWSQPTPQATRSSVVSGMEPRADFATSQGRVPQG